MKEGIPNYSCPADLFDRLIIERLKIVQLVASGHPEAQSKCEQIEVIVTALKDEIKKVLVVTNANLDHFTEYLDDLIVAVSIVSYCENEKARQHKMETVDVDLIARLDSDSRAANEKRSQVKNNINQLFVDIQSFVEQRTF